MLTIPVPSLQLKKSFLSGLGNFQLATDGDAWKAIVDADGVFTRDVDAVADVAIGAGGSFAFGAVTGLKVQLSGKAAHLAQIVWPDRDAELLKQYGLSAKEGELYARVVMMAEGSVGATAPIPAGPVAVSVGAAVAGHIAYERWIRRDAATLARLVLHDLYRGIQLPQHISVLEDLPEPGELLVTKYGGSLSLSTTVGWSHSMTGAQQLGGGRLAPIVNFRARLTASASFKYALSGEFQIEARRAGTDGWVRFVVRKSRDSQTMLAADFGFTADAKIQNVAKSTDDILEKLLGAHADRVLDVFNRARTYSDVDKLREAAGDLLFQAIHKYSNEVLKIALDNTTLRQVLDAMHRVVDAYEKLDERIIALYHNVLDGIAPAPAKIINGIDIVLGQGTREDLAALARTDNARFTQALDLLRLLYDDRIFDILAKEEEFQEAVKLLRTVRDFLNGDADAHVKQWIDTIKRHLPIDDLLTQLAQFDTPAEIHAAADARLKALVGSLTGKAFEKLKDTEIDEALAVVHNELEKINAFRKKLDAQIKKALTQSFEAKLHFAYSRARRNERLLDLEVNLAHPDGERLADLAANGRFAEVLDRFDMNAVRINKGLFTAELTEAAEVRLNVLGWGLQGVTSLVQKVEHSIESQAGGLLHLYASDTELEKKRKSGWRFQEELRARLTVQALGETFQPDKTAFRPFAVDTLRKMSADYQLLRRDAKTSVEELVQYLQLAADLGLLDVPPAIFANALREQCGGELGAVDVRYVVKFDTQSLRAAFVLARGELEEAARSATREFLLRRFAPKGGALMEIGFAYNDAAMFALHLEGTLPEKTQVPTTIPAWATGGTVQRPFLKREKLAIVNTLFNRERSLVKALLHLDALVDAGAKDFEPLNDALRDFLSAGGALDEDASVFTAVLDRLIELGSRGTAVRDSAVIVEATPQTGPNAGKKVTRHLAAGPKDPAEVAVD